MYKYGVKSRVYMMSTRNNRAIKVGKKAVEEIAEKLGLTATAEDKKMRTQYAQNKSPLRLTPSFVLHLPPCFVVDKHTTAVVEIPKRCKLLLSVAKAGSRLVVCSFRRVQSGQSNSTQSWKFRKRSTTDNKLSDF